MGEVAREVLDSAREPPMRRDHWLNVSDRIVSEKLQAHTKSILKQHGLNERGRGVWRLSGAEYRGDRPPLRGAYLSAPVGVIAK